jgi:hypothetical protein
MLPTALQTAFQSSGLSLRSLAGRTGISHSYLMDILAGRSYPSLAIRDRLTEFFQPTQAADLFPPRPPSAAALAGITCKRCGSTDLTKAGMDNDRQRYRCHSCRCVFVAGAAPLRGRLPSETIALIMHSFFQGLTYEAISELLESTGSPPISNAGLSHLIDRCCHKAVQLTENHYPAVSDRWLLDGDIIDRLAFLDFIDPDSGFIIASEVVSALNQSDGESAFARAVRLTGRKPALIMLSPALLGGTSADCADPAAPVMDLNAAQEACLAEYQQSAGVRSMIISRRLNTNSLAACRQMNSAWRVHHNYFSASHPAGVRYMTWEEMVEQRSAEARMSDRA